MRHWARTLALLPTLALGACAVPEWDSFRAPDLAIFRPTAVSALRETTTRPVQSEDLVSAEGFCAGVAAAETGSDPGTTASQAGVPLIPAGVALDMTECDVVKRAGHPEKVDIGTNERSERTATLTYIRGARPGIYHFTAGRLSSMDRAPEPPSAPRRQQAKPKRASS